MQNFTYSNPTRVVFGRDTIKRIGLEIRQQSIQKVLLLYGRASIFENGVYKAVTASLNEQGVEFIELGGIQPNPLLSKVREAISLARQHQVQGILAVGGGSVIDSAKAVALGVHYQGEVWDFFENRVRAKAALPVFTVLTLSATGSEMNQFAVITKEDEQKKWSISSPLLYPRVSIIDPLAQTSLSSQQTVNGAVDALSHIFEYYFDGLEDTDLQDEIAEGIIRTIIRHVKILVAQPSNYESRAQLAWCAAMALNGTVGIGHKGGDWASHSIEHSLSALYDIDHGRGLAVIMPAWMRYVSAVDYTKFERLAERVFNIYDIDAETKSLEAIISLRDLYLRLGAPVTLRELGIPYADLERIADNATIEAPLGTFKKLFRGDVLEILKLAY
ncbi:MAG: iron-containing alcohol dehydrogenase [Firmicutes bacterium]|nr:iron-containing alcohol dehydrogenase [Bacillota bacterium]